MFRKSNRAAVASPEPAITKAEENEFFAQARSWDDDRVACERRSRQLAWTIGGLACTVALAQAVGMAFLLPLKRVEPYVVRVDSSTGIVDNVVRISDARETYDEVMSKYFLRKYVTLRESYTRAQVQNNYNDLSLFTSPKLRAGLREEFAFASLNSPYARLGEHGVSEVRIKSVSFMARNIGQVRYVVTERRAGVEAQRHMLATMEFQYVAQPASEDTRGVNPLGFLVTNWRSDPEAAQSAEVTLR